MEGSYYQHELDRLEEEQEAIDQNARQLEKSLRRVMESGEEISMDLQWTL